MFKELFELQINGTIDVGSSGIKGLSLKNKKFDRFVIEKFSIEEEDKFLRLNDAMGEVVNKLKLKNRNVVMTLPAQEFFIKFIDLELNEDMDKEVLINEELEDIIPGYSAENYITQELLLKEEGNYERIMTMSIDRERVESLLEVMDSNKVKVLTILPDFIATINLLERIREESGKTEEQNLMLLDMGSENLKIFITTNSLVKVNKVANIGGNDLTQIIMESKNIGFLEAEQEKRTLEVRNETLEDDVEVNQADMFLSMTKLFEDIFEQIRMSMDFFYESDGISKVDKIILIGGGTLMRGFKKNVEEEFKTETEYFTMASLNIGKKNFDKLGETSHALVAPLVGSIVNEVA